MKASDIDEGTVLKIIVTQSTDGRWAHTDLRWTFTNELWWMYNDYFALCPFKVFAAKLSKMERKGLVDGCACGCRGDWMITTLGADKIGFDHAYVRSDARINPLVKSRMEGSTS